MELEALEHFHHAGVKWHDPFLVRLRFPREDRIGLAPDREPPRILAGNGHGLAVKVQIGPMQAQQFRLAKPGRHRQLEEHPPPLAIGLGEHGLDFLGREDPLALRLSLALRFAGERVGRDQPLILRPPHDAVERLDRLSDRGRSAALVLEVRLDPADFHWPDPVERDLAAERRIGMFDRVVVLDHRRGPHIGLDGLPVLSDERRERHPLGLVGGDHTAVDLRLLVAALRPGVPLRHLRQIADRLTVPLAVRADPAELPYLPLGIASGRSLRFVETDARHDAPAFTVCPGAFWVLVVMSRFLMRRPPSEARNLDGNTPRRTAQPLVVCR